MSGLSAGDISQVHKCLFFGKTLPFLLFPRTFLILPASIVPVDRDGVLKSFFPPLPRKRKLK